MKRSILFAGAALFALGGTAIAQEAMPPAAPDAAASPESEATPMSETAPAPEAAPASEAAPAPEVSTEPVPSASAPSTEAMPAEPGPNDASVAGSAATGASMAPPAAATSAAGAVDPARLQAAQQTVQAGWATYDKENKGSLTPLEFGKWVMAAQGQDMSSQIERTRQGRSAELPAVKVLNATAAAFSKADTNHDRAIQPDELSAFLAG